MTAIVPLTVALPLVVAAAIVAAGNYVPVHVINVVATAVAATVAVLATILIFRSSSHDLVYWFGGWQPRHGVAIGIAFTVDPFGAALAALAATLMTGALVFSYHYFEEVGYLYYTLMLIFLGALVGFSETGDLFNLFVFFELMSVAAYALAGYKVEQPRVLQGAVNFAVTNSIGAFLVLLGIALVYGKTGALNLAQIGEALAGRHLDGALIGALVLLTVGFLIKAGAVPFHFWLSDAYAVAPAPVGVLLAGVMSDLGYHAVARIYWDVFSGAAGSDAAVRGLLVGIGLLTALVGGVMCLLEADVKRIIAFLTISHGGIFLVAVGLLRGDGLAGAAVYVVADGLVKGALFLAVGAVQNRLGGSDELVLHGRGRRRRYVPLGVTFALCGLGLAALPPFGPFLAKSLVEQSAARMGWAWLAPLLTVATTCSAAAVLRAAGRIFLGLGDRNDPLLSEQPDEADDREPREPLALMLTPAVALLVAGLGLAFAPTLAQRALHQGARAVDRPARAAEVLRGAPLPPPREVAEWHGYSAANLAYGTGSAAGAAALALLLLYRRRAPELVRALAGRATGPPIAMLRAAHSGAIGDYATWVAVGTALFAVVWGASLR